MFVIGGVKSGAGKTTVTLGIMEALKRRGLKVQPFKAGPDYIDTGLHSSVCGVASYNLDTWMMGTRGVKKTFSRVAAGCDVAVIEGVMGLFDGRGGKSEVGSTAHLAKALDLPVILVVDATSMARSVAALVEGFIHFDPKVKFLGVIFNRVASERHEQIIEEAVRKIKGIKTLGFIPRDSGLSLPERHLGLVSSEHIAKKEWGNFIKHSGNMADRHIDIDTLIKASKQLRITDTKPTPTTRKQTKTVIAVARDPAFSFYYQENLDILKSFGARLAFFSPLTDASLPEGTEGIYLGGGYPELFAAELEDNLNLKKEIRKASKHMPILAECGGLIYLGRALTTANGNTYKMAGLFPWTTKMKDTRVALGYREVCSLEGSPFIKAGAKIKGHEFHYSDMKKTPAGISRSFSVDGNREEGFTRNSTLATYIHLHFASNPDFAKKFAESCYQDSSKTK